MQKKKFVVVVLWNWKKILLYKLYSRRAVIIVNVSKLLNTNLLCIVLLSMLYFFFHTEINYWLWAFMYTKATENHKNRQIHRTSASM